MFIIYFTCIVSLYRNDPTPRKIDRWLVFQTLYIYMSNIAGVLLEGGRHGHDRMIVEFTTTYAVSTYHH
jgi:hypothetical protein